MIRILDYLNVSSKNLLADSGFHVQKNIIKYILRKRSDFFFYLTIPRETYNLVSNVFKDLENIMLLPIKYTMRGSLNKFMVDLVSLRKVFNWRKYYVNIIYSNEPYVTPLLIHLFKSIFPFTRASVMNYIHWFEIPINNRIGDFYLGNTYMWLITAVILYSDMTFTNSNYGINLYMPYIEKIAKSEFLDEIRRKFKKLVIGVDVEELDKYRPDNIEKMDYPVFIFNSRMYQYTGASYVLKTAFKLAENGYRFKIVFTNPTKHFLTTGYAEKVRKYRDKIILLKGLPYPEYVKLLWRSDFVIAWHMGYYFINKFLPVNQWSIALIEGVVCENYPVAHSLGFFPEIIPKEYLLEPSDDSLEKFMIYAIDNVEYFRKKAKVISSFIRERFDWYKVIDDWIKVFEKLYALYEGRMSSPTEKTILKLKRILSRKGMIHWSEFFKELNWGHLIKGGRDMLYLYMTRICREIPSPEPVFECKSLSENSGKRSLGDYLW